MKKASEDSVPTTPDNSDVDEMVDDEDDVLDVRKHNTLEDL